jgi:hypothetical protein
MEVQICSGNEPHQSDQPKGEELDILQVFLLITQADMNSHQEPSYLPNKST